VLAGTRVRRTYFACGPAAVVRAELTKHAAPNLPIEIVAASDVITMNDHPAAGFSPQEGQFGARGGRAWWREAIG